MSLEEFSEEVNRYLMEDERPSEYLWQVEDSELFLHSPFEMLHRMGETKQSPKYHPGGNVQIHTLMMVDEAAKRGEESTEPRVPMWVAMLHDIRKPGTARLKRGKITSYNHDREGERLAREFSEISSEDETFIKTMCGLVHYHVQILFLSEKAELAELGETKRQVDIRGEVLLGLYDRLGRDGVGEKKEKEGVREFLLACTVGEGELRQDGVRQGGVT